MVTLGSALTARLLRLRAATVQELAARSRELEYEKELFSRESVRLERMRTARELHDIVAHCVSVMVVQAGAGQRPTDTDPEAAAEALAAIAEIASQAESEIGALVELLATDAPDDGLSSTQLIDELVTRMRAAHLDVRLRLDTSATQLTGAAADATYRVVQEALTNALKHSPGAPISIGVLDAGAAVEIVVENAAPPGVTHHLEGVGGGHRLTGMRDRVLALGGNLEAGPTEQGGWRVRALLSPLSPTRETRSTRPPGNVGNLEPR